MIDFAYKQRKRSGIHAVIPIKSLINDQLLTRLRMLRQRHDAIKVSFEMLINFTRLGHPFHVKRLLSLFDMTAADARRDPHPLSIPPNSRSVMNFFQMRGTLLRIRRTSFSAAADTSLNRLLRVPPHIQVKFCTKEQPSPENAQSRRDAASLSISASSIRENPL